MTVVIKSDYVITCLR